MLTIENIQQWCFDDWIGTSVFSGLCLLCRTCYAAAAHSHRRLQDSGGWAGNEWRHYSYQEEQRYPHDTNQCKPRFSSDQMSLLLALCRQVNVFQVSRSHQSHRSRWRPQHTHHKHWTFTFELIVTKNDIILMSFQTCVLWIIKGERLNDLKSAESMQTTAEGE